MKKILLPFCLGLLTFLSSQAQTTNTLPTYPMKFLYNSSNGIQRDTLLSKLSFRMWKMSNNYPAYVKWKSQPFAVLRSSIDGLGLFTDSVSSFTTGQEIGWIYYKVNSSGRFDMDYLDSNIGLFINNSDNPNAELVQTSQGIKIKATRAINSVSEITIRYQDILNLFPNDPSAVRKIKYWL